MAMTAQLTPDDSVARTIGELLIARGERVAVCETTAGGLISARLLSVPGASAWFDRGVVTYGGQSKQQLTGVDSDMLRTSGAVSVEAVQAMAEGLRALAGTAWAVAESGIAGPQTSRRSIKPAGSVAIAVVGPDHVSSADLVLPGDRVEVMGGIADAVLSMLEQALRTTGG